MNTSTETRAKRLRAFVPSTALAKSVEFDEAMVRVALPTGASCAYPWSGSRCSVTPRRSSARYEIGGGIGLHWPDLDEDLSIAGLMAGVDWRSA